MKPIRTDDRAKAVAGWTACYDGDTSAALERVTHMRQHGIPEGHTAEWLGACLALTPYPGRCQHWGDRKTCTQCLLEELLGEGER